ncbi:MAG: hypothetical protein C4326_08980 [Ignavibacteria bacterium]
MLTTLLQAVLIVGVALPVLLNRSFRRTFASVKRSTRWFSASLWLLIVVGHLAARNTFPFVGWMMYGSVEKGDPALYRYTALLRSGTSTELVPSRLLSAMMADRVSSKLYRQIVALHAASDTAQQRALLMQHKETLATLGRRYNEMHPNDPARSIIVSKVVVYLHPRAGQYSSAPAFLWEAIVPQEEK